MPIELSSANMDTFPLYEPSKTYIYQSDTALQICFYGLQEDSITVVTKYGAVKGRKTQTFDQRTTYYAFQGIPYAKAPVDDLRFKAPVPPNRWSGYLTTQDDKHKCLDIFLEGSEDCLYINVFTPDYESSALPVMVWIYGGAFVYGDSKLESYAPDYFLEDGVVIVTFNYRTGVFVLKMPLLQGNYGTKDQLLALKWVHENIEKFGGDPKRVTIFGQSAGSASVSYLLQTPLAKVDFLQKAIMQSGTSLNIWALSRNPRKTAFAIGRILGIDTQNSTELVEQLKRLSQRLQIVSLTASTVRTILLNNLHEIKFAPTIEPELEGAVITKKVVKCCSLENLVEFHAWSDLIHMKAFIFITVPSQDRTIQFLNVGVVIDRFLRPYMLLYDMFLIKLVPVDMNIKSRFEEALVGFSIRKKYFCWSPICLAKEQLAQVQYIVLGDGFLTDTMFVRSIHEYVALVSQFVPLYYYILSYKGDLGVNGNARRILGIGHNEDLSYLWRSERNIDNPSEGDILTRKRLVKLWTNFAKTS
ncbi:hypothetical protein NQ317_008830 [Molorchus minor]|uniref:Carboxylic ester hydrolase n=1 Tax=Molorchus minor TaxID=1323400 RepID=A0ABQ9IUI9_9CUCU|nr:hypothetical protein NQ317_008830 [Molorchus minor]